MDVVCRPAEHFDYPNSLSRTYFASLHTRFSEGSLFGLSDDYLVLTGDALFQTDLPTGSDSNSMKVLRYSYSYPLTQYTQDMNEYHYRS